MQINLGGFLRETDLNEFEHISSFGVYEIYRLESDSIYFIAVDNALMICSYFEFAEIEEGLQLAHMYVLPSLKGQGIGTAILEQAVEIYTTFELPSTDPNDIYYFIEDGLGFIKSCFKNGTLTDPPFKNPSGRRLDDY